MNIIEVIIKEVEAEAITTRKMLSRVPADQLQWQPHPRSMTMKQLAAHIAELPSWISLALNTSELDFATNPYQPIPFNNTNDLLAIFEQALQKGLNDLKQAKEEDLLPNWTLRNGEQIYLSVTK